MASRDLLKQFQGLTLDNVGTWPPAPRFALWLVIIIAFGVGGWFGLWSGQTEQLEQLHAEEEKLKGEYKNKMQQAQARPVAAVPATPATATAAPAPAVATAAPVKSAAPAAPKK